VTEKSNNQKQDAASDKTKSTGLLRTVSGDSDKSPIPSNGRPSRKKKAQKNAHDSSVSDSHRSGETASSGAKSSEKHKKRTANSSQSPLGEQRGKKGHASSVQKQPNSSRGTSHPSSQSTKTLAANNAKKSKNTSAKAGKSAAADFSDLISAIPVVSAAKTAKKQKSRKSKNTPPASPVKIISLGGLDEIGKNITVFESGDDIIVVDCGMAFPDEEMLGVDLVLPDFTYLEKNKEKIRGIFITHGHEDHIGGLPFLLRSINVPVYGAKLTLGLIENKLKEFGLLGQIKLNVTEAGDVIKAGCFSVEFIHVNHSIPDACAFAIYTPAGIIVMTGDFKVDFTPISGKPIDLVRFGELGSMGVLALLSDSTNAERPGRTPSERVVGESFDKLFLHAQGKRIIVATFASNVYRIQQVIDTAEKLGRKVAILGRSMVNVVAKATELGYLRVNENTIIDVETLRNYTDDQIVLVTTGSQGEPMSALTRMSSGDHRKVRIGPNDYVIISATPIPGNEKLVGKVVNELMKLGADVIYEKSYDIHVSGHACRDDIRLILSLTRPRFFIPIHGEYKHLVKNSNIAKSMGFDSKNIIISDIGKVIETDGVSMKITGTVPSGKVFVDGLGVGDVGSIVLRDRKLLSEDGLIVAVLAVDEVSGEIVAGPDLVSRGFVYVRESEEIMNGAHDVVMDAFSRCEISDFRDWNSLKSKIRDELGDYIYAKTKRRPIILPIIQIV